MAVRGGGARQAERRGGGDYATRALNIYAERRGEKPGLPKREVDALLAGLKDDSPIERHSALKQLIGSKTRRAREAVLSCLNDPNFMVRREAVRGLEVFRISEKLEKLASMLADDENAEVRAQAARSIASLSDARARSCLLDALKKERVQVALKGICDALGKVGKAEDISAISELERFRDDGLDRRVCKALGDIGDFSALPYLMKIIDRTAYESAAWAIARIAEKSEENDEKIVGKLVADLQDADLKTRENAAYVLGTMGSKKAVEWIYGIVSNNSLRIAQPKRSDEHSEVRHDALSEGAVYASTWMVRSEVTEILREWVEYRHTAGDMALFSLGIRGDASDIKRISRFLGDDEPIKSESIMRRAIYWELKGDREEAITPEIVPESITRSFVAETALHALARKHGKKVLAHLIGVYNENRASNPSVRDAAVRAIYAIHNDEMKNIPEEKVAEGAREKEWGSEVFKVIEKIGLTDMRFKKPILLEAARKEVIRPDAGVSQQTISGKGGKRYFCFCTSFHAHPTKEVSVYIVNGEVKILVGHEKTEKMLGAGDALNIAEGIPHQIINAGFGEAQVIETETPPTKRDIVRFEHPYKTHKKMRGY